MLKPWEQPADWWKLGTEDEGSTAVPFHAATQDRVKGKRYTFMPPQVMMAYRVKLHWDRSPEIDVSHIEKVTCSNGIYYGHIDDLPWYERKLLARDYPDLNIFIGVPDEYSGKGVYFAFPLLPNAGEGSLIEEAD